MTAMDLFDFLSEPCLILQRASGGVVASHWRSVDAEDEDGDRATVDVPDRKVFVSYEDLAAFVREYTEPCWSPGGDVERVMRSRME
jgi:hypothetical protein